MLTVVQEICSELYNGQIDSSQDWLECLMKDDRSCLVDDCMLMCGIGSSLDLQPSPVSSEHSYSLAADLSHSAPVIKTELSDCRYFTQVSH